MTTEAIAKALGIDPATIAPPIPTVNPEKGQKTEYILSMVEKIHWSKASDQLPDSDETVLIFSSGADEPVWFGYHDGTGWRLADGFPLSNNEVTFWTPMPRGPQ